MEPRAYVMINRKMIGFIAAASLLILGSYIAFSNRERAPGAALSIDPAQAPDTAPPRERMESVSLPRVSTEFQQLPESNSAGVAQLRAQPASSNRH